VKGFSAIVAAGVLALALAVPAAAAPRLVAPSESEGNPAFAGDEIVYLHRTPNGGSEVRAVAPDGKTRAVATLGTSRPWLNPWDEGLADFARTLIEVRGSSQALGVRTMELSGDRYGHTERTAVMGGPTRGPLGNVGEFCQQDWQTMVPTIDVDGDRLAYVRDDCSRGGVPRQVAVRDLSTGLEWLGPATATREVRLAGRYLAYHPAGRAGALEVYDIDAGQAVRTLDGTQGGRFDVQADGTVADSARSPYESCRGVLVWRPGTDTPTQVAGCEWTLGAIDGDHLALSSLFGYRGEREALAVLPLGGRAREIQLPGPLDQQPDLDGNRIVFSTSGCSTDTGGVWIDDGADSPPPPAQAECSVRIRDMTLRATPDGKVRVPVICPRGCRGAIQISGGRGYRQHFNSPWVPYGSSDMFQRESGQAVRVPVNVGDLRKRYGRRTLKVRVEVRINKRSASFRFVRAVRYMKLRV
jgi:hypothetical protein